MTEIIEFDFSDLSPIGMRRWAVDPAHLAAIVLNRDCDGEMTVFVQLQSAPKEWRLWFGKDDAAAVRAVAAYERLLKAKIEAA